MAYGKTYKSISNWLEVTYLVRHTATENSTNSSVNVNYWEKTNV